MDESCDIHLPFKVLNTSSLIEGLTFGGIGLLTEGSCVLFVRLLVSTGTQDVGRQPSDRGGKTPSVLILSPNSSSEGPYRSGSGGVSPEVVSGRRPTTSFVGDKERSCVTGEVPLC